ncbi:response regulator [Geomonas sp. RF6]|uniref:hybrid sensor histidine kinase/response regulator n=1 Tax=Geomonas sp. RF6 TaxID=2897342 RepID=UPI001E512233|nr:response regulator [Geomonas sp. RF6]UFS69605.1 response regulator [Geomonas sp. RF6]
MGSSPHTILVVDDSPTQAKLLEQILQQEGFRVLVAHNGREAFETVCAEQPDLLISDIMMPEMDGFELCRGVRETAGVGGIPIILLTLLDNPADVLRSLEAGATYFISKPYNRELLLSRIRASIERGPDRSGGGGARLDVEYRGHHYSIPAEKDQIVDLLLATYEMAVDKNQELNSAKQALRVLNRELEKRVAERSAALSAETAERLAALEELRRKDEVLMQQSRQAAMGEMIGNIAHQWRQPLNGVGLLIQDITLCFEDGDFSREYLEATTKKIMQLIQHMSQTIDDFRNFFMPDKEKVSFDVHQVVVRTLTLVAGDFSDKGIRREVVAQDHPTITGYPNEFSQVLLNMFSNARDAHLERKTENPWVKVTLSSQEGRALVLVEDNAGGIPEEIIGRIFEPYFTTKEQGKGTGVGLYMAKNIVEKNMNGSLTVCNTPVGVQFRIEV